MKIQEVLLLKLKHILNRVNPELWWSEEHQPQTTFNYKIITVFLKKVRKIVKNKCSQIKKKVRPVLGVRVVPAVNLISVAFPRIPHCTWCVSCSSHFLLVYSVVQSNICQCVASDNEKYMCSPPYCKSVHVPATTCCRCVSV